MNILETKSIWEYLKTTTLPIYIYGMGDGCVKIMAALELYSIKLSGIFASDNFVRGHSFAGYKVLRLSQVRELHSKFIVLLAFAAYREPLLSELYNMQNSCEFYAPDLPVVNSDSTLFDLEYLNAHKDDLQYVENILADTMSKHTFNCVLNFKVSGKINYLRECQSNIDEVYKNIIKPQTNEDYIDLGAYNGDTIEELLRYTNGQYHSITAFEPDKKSFKKLTKYIDENKITAKLYNLGVWNKAETLTFANRGGRNSSLSKNGSIDVEVTAVDLLCDKATIIKYDVEGAEYEAINGCRKLIQTQKPRLMVSAYHKNADLYYIPKLILSINPTYKVYLRHHPYIPAWETNYYFI